MADGGGGDSHQGNCSMNSMWELKASSDGDGLQPGDHGGHHGIEVEFRIRTDHNGKYRDNHGGNHRGDLWNWMISDNGTMAKQGTGHANQGDDSLRRRINIPNADGPDTIQLDAMNTVTGETCQGQVVVRGGRHHH
jgi:hypothetical protein